jgi:hypothetical protein
MSLFEENKPVIRKKNNVIEVGSNTQQTEIKGRLSVAGSIRVNSPAYLPTFGGKEKIKIFSYDQRGVGWVNYCPQSLMSLSGVALNDFIYVQSTVGFRKNDNWVLNPGCPSNMESGKVLFTLGSKLFISGSGANSGLFYNHNKGERIINLTYAL